MDDDATRWFEDEPPPRRSRRPAALLAAAAVPWVVVAALLQRGPAGPDPADSAAVATATQEPDPAPAEPAAPGDDPATGQAPAPGSPTAAVPDEGTDPALAPPDRDPATDAARWTAPTAVLHGVAEAVVVAATRAWLSDAGPDLDAPGIDVDRGGYLEHVAVERIDLVAPEAAVATVATVVLRREGDVYVDALVRRAAVPLTVTSTSVHPAGTPWWLPRPPDLSVEPPAAAPDDDPTITAAVAEALTDAGYGDATVRGVARTDDDVLVADVTASTPDGDRIDGAVWLLPTEDGLALLGHHPDDT